MVCGEMVEPVTYRVTDVKPYFSIPSARGDAFAKYEYDFDTP